MPDSVAIHLSTYFGVQATGLLLLSWASVNCQLSCSVDFYPMHVNLFDGAELAASGEQIY
jgi:hypothetical protein